VKSENCGVAGCCTAGVFAAGDETRPDEVV
jgi:hypothetical protein